MTPFAALVSVASVAAAGCHGNIHGLGAAPEPIVTIHGRLSSPLPSAIAHPRAAVVWAGVPVYISYCQKHGPNPRDPGRMVSEVAAKACRNPFFVVPGLEEASVPLDRASLTFEIPILHLPIASVLVGNVPSRVGYASVMIYDDADGDGALNFTRCGFRGGDPGEGVTSTVSPARFEQVWASSFSTLLTTQTRIAYVEGQFDKGSFYYPSPSSCAPPPGGFSEWIVGGLLDANAGCESRPIDQEITLDVHDASGMPKDPLFTQSCAANPREAYPHEPPSKLPQGTTIWECSSEGELVTTNSECPCPNSRIYTLKGCSYDAGCTSYEWNVPVPPFWPCPVPMSGSGSGT